MAKPNSFFTLASQANAINLSVQFTDRSYGVPTTWEWDFGFVGGVSTLQNPLINFPEPGTYVVSLASSNADGESIYTREVSILRHTTNLGLTIQELVEVDLPTGISITPTTLLPMLIKKWQIYLQHQLNIPDADVHNENKWSAMANIFISKLVSYDLIMKDLRGAMSTSSATSSGKGSVKKIETGPSNVEWYNATESTKETFKEGGFMSGLIDELCMYASKLGIFLPLCKYLNKPQLFKVVNKKRRCH